MRASVDRVSGRKFWYAEVRAGDLKDTSDLRLPVC